MGGLRCCRRQTEYRDFYGGTLDPFTFRHTRWGMTLKEVLASEPMAPIEVRRGSYEDPEEDVSVGNEPKDAKPVARVAYRILLLGIEAALEYQVEYPDTDCSSLARARYYTNFVTERDAWEAICRDLLRELVGKYGRPTSATPEIFGYELALGCSWVGGERWTYDTGVDLFAKWEVDLEAGGGADAGTTIICFERKSTERIPGVAAEVTLQYSHRGGCHAGGNSYRCGRHLGAIENAI